MYDKITLPNGVRIVSERIPYVRSASLGVWIGAGSRHEAAAESGAAHFIEHMAFKGTTTLSAAELAQFMDSVGGQVNAFTTKECTCYHGRVIDTRLEAFAEVLGDMLLNTKFADADVESERGVILEEIDMYEDTPEDVVAESLHRKLFAKSSLSRPILGREKTLSAMTGETLRAFKREKYVGSTIVVSLSGRFEDSQLSRLSEIFSALPSGAARKPKNAAYTPSRISRKKALEQNHLLLAFPGIAVTDMRRYTLQLLSDILGGGMSSRLFQSVRESRGLCYSIYSYTSSYTDCGIFSIATALGAESQSEALPLIFSEIARFRDGGVTREELDRALEQVRASLLMSLESTSARMNRLGHGELFLGAALPPEEIVARYESVTRDDIADLAREVLTPSNMSVSVLGRAVPSADALQALDF